MSSKQKIAKYFLPLSIALGLILTIWLRTPLLKEGSPYLYREDEAHHFNRILNMMKSGDYNPHYFHKPSLHFYLRLPVVAAAFLWSVKKGELSSLHEIITSDPYGLADYSFSVSHPRLLVVSRCFSLLLQLVSILLTFLICRRLISSVWLSLFASALFWCALSAGLAVSSKYNSLPIIALPIIVYLKQMPLNLERGLIAIFCPWISFLLASPFILFSLPEFLNQLGYEIWHYGVAGHVGHMAEPGLSQVKFYINWLSGDGLGLIATSLAFCGVIFILLKINQSNIKIAAIFPILFFLLMVSQKANFERNMVVIIPFFAIFAALSLSELKKILPTKLIYILSIFAVIQPLINALELRASTTHIPESRIAAASQIESLAQQGQELALDGKLQFTRKLLEVPGVSRTDFSNASPFKAYQDGFDYLVIKPSDSAKMLENNFFESFMKLEGDYNPQRIVKNPAIEFLKRRNITEFSKIDHLSIYLTSRTLNFPGPKSDLSFTKEPDSQIWLQNTLESILVKTSDSEFLPQNLNLKLFTPWPNQILTFYLDSKIIEHDMSEKSLSDVNLPLNSGLKEQLIIVKSTKVHSPKALGISTDTRRLAVAIKSASIN